MPKSYHELEGWKMPEVAVRLSEDIEEGWYVNLGIGIPTIVADGIPEGKEVILHSENGILGVGEKPKEGQEDPDLVNAGKEPVTLVPGGGFFSQAESFAMIRGGHLDAAVLGAYQVSAKGDVASWRLPDAKLGRVGGAMDLVAGSKRVFVIMKHCTRDGGAKILEECTFPLTGANCVNRIYTDLAVIDVTDDGLVVRELAPGVEFEDVQALTAAPLQEGISLTAR